MPKGRCGAFIAEAIQVSEEKFMFFLHVLYFVKYI